MISWLNEGLSILWWKVVHKQRGKPGEMGKAVAIPPDKEAEKKEMFKVQIMTWHIVYVSYIHFVKNVYDLSKVLVLYKQNPGEPVQPNGQWDDQPEQKFTRCQTLCLQKQGNFGGSLAFSTTFANFFDFLFVILGLREPAADHLSSNCLPQWSVDHTSQNGCVDI